MDRGRFAEMICDVESDPVSLHRFDGRAWRRAVVAPALRLTSRREFVLDFFCHEMKFLDSVLAQIGERPTIECVHWGIGAPVVATLALGRRSGLNGIVGGQGFSAARGQTCANSRDRAST